MKQDHVSLPKEFVDLGVYAPDIRRSMRYFGHDNFIGRPFVGYHADRALITKAAAKALLNVQEHVSQDGFDVVIYDTYRPQICVDDFMIWAEDISDQKMKNYYYPRINKTDAFDLGYLGRRSAHSRGSTVDLTLIKKSDSLQKTIPIKRHLKDGFTYFYLDDNTLDMGASFDMFDEASWHETKLIDECYHNHRGYLKNVMESCGFSSYRKEWWHYTLNNEPFPDTYFSFPIEDH